MFVHNALLICPLVILKFESTAFFNNLPFLMLSTSPLF